jgi:hypothetical protein
MTSPRELSLTTLQALISTFEKGIHGIPDEENDEPLIDDEEVLGNPEVHPFNLNKEFKGSSLSKLVDICLVGSKAPKINYEKQIAVSIDEPPHNYNVEDRDIDPPSFDQKEFEAAIIESSTQIQTKPYSSLDESSKAAIIEKTTLIETKPYSSIDESNFFDSEEPSTSPALVPIHSFDQYESAEIELPPIKETIPRGKSDIVQFPEISDDVVQEFKFD